jgi:hypothetical protein
MSRKLRHRSHHGVHEESSVGPAPTEQEELELLAYGYWQERGRPLGEPDEDWFRAEKELQRRDEAAARL